MARKPIYRDDDERDDDKRDDETIDDLADLFAQKYWPERPIDHHDPADQVQDDPLRRPPQRSS